MIPRWDYLVKPLGDEHITTKKIAGVDFVINTSIEDAKYVNRLGVVLSAPEGAKIPVGSIVVVHHNVFRTYLDMKGEKRKSNEYFRDGKYLVPEFKIYLYNNGKGWEAPDEYCFVSPMDYVHDSDVYRSDKKEEEHVGLVKYSSAPGLNQGDKVGFTKNSEYEFTIDDEKLYRIRVQDICINFN